MVARRTLAAGVERSGLDERRCVVRMQEVALTARTAIASLRKISGAACFGREPRDCVRCGVDEGIDCYVKNVLA